MAKEVIEMSLFKVDFPRDSSESKSKVNAQV